MKPLMSPQKQKFLVVLIEACVSFFGFQSISLAIETYQIPKFFEISFYVYIFLVVWQMFVFDLHLKTAATWHTLRSSFLAAIKDRFSYLKERRHWLHFHNYLLLPGIVYWTTIAMIYLNPFDELRKQVWIFLSALALTMAFWYLKTVFYAHSGASRTARELIFLTKLYGSFLAFAAALGIGHYFGYGPVWFGLSIFLLSFVLVYQAMFQHHYVGFKTLKFLLGTGIFLGVVGYFVYRFWNVNFYTGALVIAALYNTIWGLLQHAYVDKNLSREIVLEYLAVLFVILVIVFSTTNFAERI